MTATPSLRDILTDYAQSLQHLVSLVGSVYTRVDNAWNDRVTTMYKDIYEELTHAEFRRIRLHDLTGKAGFDALLRHVTTHLRQNDVPGIDGYIKYVHFSRSQPGLTIEIPAGQHYRLGVQIQGSSYRHFLSCEENVEGLERLAVEALLWARWFGAAPDGRDLQGHNGTRLEQFESLRKGRLTNLRVFNPNRFLYSAFSLDGSTLEQLARALVESISRAVELSQEWDRIDGLVPRE